MADPVQLFFKNVQSNPDHTAVVFESGDVSYGEIGTLVNRIAAAISHICEKPRVLIYLPKGVEAYAAMFGTLMAGGYYSPINMDAPVQRHLEIMRQFCPDVVVSTAKLAENLPGVDIEGKLVDVENVSVEELSEPLEPHDLAYVFFTSGSTGKPKGVMIPRDGLAYYVDWALDAMSVSSDDRWSQHPNIAFDLSVLDIYGALCGGATLYPLTSYRDKLLPADFIKRHQLTIWNSVPSVVDLMLKARQVSEKNLASLRLLTFCGEPLLPRYLDAVFCANNQVVVHNTYGPTEATVSCTLIRLTADNYQKACRGSVALGHPIPGMDFLLQDGDCDEGELVITGPQLARGYWRNESETAKAFFTVVVDEQDKPAYRTGDWVSRKDGEYYFSGRIDSQIKIRGNRVELGEIDTTISQLGLGNSCTVFFNDQLHTFIETKEMPDFQELKKMLGDYLPEYEIPSALHAVKSLPVNTNDKVDRLALVRLVEQYLADK